MIIVMNARRTVYSKEDAAKKSITVGDLICMLEQFDEDDIIVTGHDNGYTYGEIQDFDFEEFEADKD